MSTSGPPPPSYHSLEVDAAPFRPDMMAHVIRRLDTIERTQHQLAEDMDALRHHNITMADNILRLSERMGELQTTMQAGKEVLSRFSSLSVNLDSGLKKIKTTKQQIKALGDAKELGTTKLVDLERRIRALEGNRGSDIEESDGEGGDRGAGANSQKSPEVMLTDWINFATSKAGTKPGLYSGTQVRDRRKKNLIVDTIIQKVQASSPSAPAKPSTPAASSSNVARATPAATTAANTPVADNTDDQMGGEESEEEGSNGGKVGGRGRIGY